MRDAFNLAIDLLISIAYDDSTTLRCINDNK